MGENNLLDEVGQSQAALGAGGQRKAVGHEARQQRGIGIEQYGAQVGTVVNCHVISGRQAPV
ncbi:MAG: hypothetical protein KatS3mg032_1815 [Cyclobacteriaceae bacterium]|nr:MAG: hypothetical protein KatS3mg032_1815 [Cyclobacteriaceae bacterium]